MIGRFKSMIFTKYSCSRIIIYFKRILLISHFIFFSCISNSIKQQLNFHEMGIQIEKGSFSKTTSILISQKRKAIYEK